MIARFAKLGTVVQLFIVASLSILLCLGVGLLLTYMENGSQQSPVRSLEITLDKSERENFWSQLRKFSDKHHFNFVFSDYGTGDNFLVEITGDDIKILASIIRQEPEHVFVGFYAKSPGDPPPDIETISDLIDDLKTFLYDIPNIKVIEE